MLLSPHRFFLSGVQVHSILVTNDDGIHSEGLIRLAEALDPLGKVTIVAPDRECSAASHALTLHRPLRLRSVGERTYVVDGTPADCVYLGALSVLERKPDLVASGINHGSNIGDDVTYSGTIAAAFEGTVLGIPSFAVSLAGDSEFDFGPASIMARTIATRILDRGIPSDLLLNINVPAGDVNGVRCTRQGKRMYRQFVSRIVDPRGKSGYWVGGGEASGLKQSEDTDYTAVKQGFVSVTPLQLDLTHGEALEAMRGEWEQDLNDGMHC